MYTRQIVAAILLSGVCGIYAAEQPLAPPAFTLTNQATQSVSGQPVRALSEPLDQDSLTLTAATRLVLANNPELQVFRWRSQAIDGMRQTAELRPAYELSVSAENVAGSNDFSGIDNAELTLALSSIIELGGKRGFRSSVVDSRYALLQAEQQVKALDLLGAVTQGFIATLSLQQKVAVAQEAMQLAEQSYELVSTRVKRGAAPQAERLRAQATLTQAKMQYTAVVSELKSRKFALASLWKADRATFKRTDGDLFNFVDPADFDSLYRRVSASPTIQVFASEERVRDAELALVLSQSASDVRWGFGVRRLEATGDTALIGEIAVPLFSKRRNRGEVQSALADREVVQYQREASLLAVRARLFQAWQTYQQSADAARQMRAEVLPALEKALEQTRRAYEQGRYSYVDWVTAQRELLDARLRSIDAATTALLNQSLIEQLTAEPLAAELLSTSSEQKLNESIESPQR